MFARSFQSLEGIPDTRYRMLDGNLQAIFKDFQGLTVDAVFCYTTTFFKEILPVGVSL